MACRTAAYVTLYFRRNLNPSPGSSSILRTDCSRRRARSTVAAGTVLKITLNVEPLNLEPPQGFERSEAVEPFDRTQGRLLERPERIDLGRFVLAV